MTLKLVCTSHSYYSGIDPPDTDCKDCQKIWEESEFYEENPYDPPGKKIVKMYAHGSKDSNRDTWVTDLNQDPNLLNRDMDFLWAFNEVEFEVEVDTTTGKFDVLSVECEGKKYYPLT